MDAGYTPKGTYRLVNGRLSWILVFLTLKGACLYTFSWGVHVYVGGGATLGKYE